MREVREYSPQPQGHDIVIIGNPDLIGDKARNLLQYTPRLREIGFSTPPRWFLAQDVIESLLKEPGDVPTENHLQIFGDILAQLGDGPVMVRSSAAGDARGTGIYHSDVSASNIDYLSDAVRKVVSSYSSPAALEFRRKLELTPEFGLIIEPMIGQWEEGGHYFAPMLSGFGYTSTQLEPEPVIGAVMGFGADTMGSRPLRISVNDLKRYDFDLEHYADRLTEKMQAFTIPTRHNSLTTPYFNQDSNGIVWNTERGLVATYMGTLDWDTNLEKQISQLNELAQSTTNPLYFEWAITKIDERIEMSILQVATVVDRVDDIEFNQVGKPVLEADEVVTSGKVSANKVVGVAERKDLEALEVFNREHADYILFVSGRIVGNFGDFGLTDRSVEFNFTHFSNARAVIVHAGGNFNNRIEEHFKGLGDVTGILIGMYSGPEGPQREGTRRSWLFRNAPKYKDSGIRVVEGSFTVAASVSQNRMLVYQEEDPVDDLKEELQA